MATCKDCFHCDVCKNLIKDGVLPYADEKYPADKFCIDFKDKSKIIELPCKIGDTVYVIPSKANFILNALSGHEETNKIHKQKVHSIQAWETGYLIFTCEGLFSVHPKFYKKNWFLTKEEAEKALKELENNV